MVQWWCAAQGVPWRWRWQPYPGVWAFCLALVVLWARMRARWPGPEETRRRAAIYLSGVGTLWIALDWPVGALGAGYLASVHMVQYLLIALVAPPLLLIGTPRGAFRALVSGPLGGVVWTLTHPLVSISLFVSIMGVTHWPWLVDTWMATQLGSFGLDLLWLLSGIVFWWPVVAPEPTRAWLTDGARIGYLIAATLVNTGVFAYLTFADFPLYATYELAPPVGSLSSQDDQLVAGLLMKVGGAPIIWTAITILFFRAYIRSDSLGPRERLSIPTEGRTPDGRASNGRASNGRTARIGVVLMTAGLPLATACGAERAGPGPAEAEWIAAGPIEVSDARVGLPPLPERAALYVDLRASGAPLRLTGVSSPDAARASLHTSSAGGSMMRMTPVEALDLPTDSVVALAPGGMHIMLEGLVRPLAVGDSVRAVLTFADGRTAPIAAAVVALEAVERARR
ncbi:MAG: cytochrome c oxidase assembly protein [Longimicrobiales bacterium]|nr:cytochrome c oxidase assembly protein [Longimicrobiales bacterium]